jgi:hypothetical protein
MSKRIAVAAVVAMVIVTMCFFFLRGHRFAPRSDADRSGVAAVVPPSNDHSSSVTSASAVDESASSSASEAAGDPTKRVSLDMIARDGDAAARLWQAHAEKVIAAKNAKDFGAENAALLRLPYDEAWRALDARAAAGDDKAFVLAVAIAGICEAESSYKAKPATSALYEGLPNGWVPFIDRLRAMRQDVHDRRVSHCVGISFKSPMDSVFEVMDRFMRPDNPEARVAIANENTNDVEAIADLRQVANETDNKQARVALGDRLLQSVDLAQQKEGLALLQQMAPDDVSIALRLAYCLENGCGHFPADPASARVWIERTAGNGDVTAFIMLLADIDAEGHVVDAWAWSRYKLDLAMAGCFETIAPTYIYIRAAALDEARRRHVLSAAQQNAGLAIYYEISGLWEREAMETLSCAD